MMNNTIEKNYMPALTGVRAVAAYLVFVHHYVMPGSLLRDVVREGHIGVSLFFVLSGFLICHRYYDKFSFSKEFIRSYVVNRVARIYPLYFILTTVTFAHFYFYKHQGSALYNSVVYFFNITFLRGFLHDFIFSGIAQGWSLTVEECFYFSAFLVFPFIKAKKVLIPLLAIFSLSFSYLLFQHLDFYGLMESLKFNMSYTYFGRCFEFFAGIFLALYLRRKGAEKLNRFPVATMTGGLGIVLVMAFLAAVRSGEAFGVYTWPGITANNWLLPLAVIAFYYGLIKERSWLTTLLGGRLFDVLGKSSYAFYLVHMGVFANFFARYVSYNPVFMFVALNLLSMFLYYTVEHPLNAYIRSALSRRKVPVVPKIQPIAVTTVRKSTFTESQQ